MSDQVTLFGLLRRNVRALFGVRHTYTAALAPAAASSPPGRPRSLFVRHLDCGSCNGCELELLALTNPVYDIHRQGIAFKPSPRQADVLALTGVFTHNLREAAERTVAAMPEPCIVTVGDCALDGGVFRDSYAVASKPAAIQGVIKDHIPGCPPSPETIQDHLLRLLVE